MTTEKRIGEWLQAPFDQETQKAVLELKKDPQKLQDAFYTSLKFGTGGMRGIMGVGTGRASSTPAAVQHGKAHFLLSLLLLRRRLVALLGVVGRQRRQARLWRVRLGVSLEPRPRRPPRAPLFPPALHVLRVRAQ